MARPNGKSGPPRFDPVAAWGALDPDQQRQLGVAAVLAGAARRAVLRPPVVVDTQRWLHAYHEAEHRLESVPIEPEAYLEGPDLAGLGIRACRGCGCTDVSACEGGCRWVETDLCSQCVGR